MVLAVADAAQHIGSLLGISPDFVAKVLWGCLLAGLFCATLHLFTMLVTRWGDNDPSRKSLVFSVLVHVSCAMGLVVISPPPAIPDVQQPAVEVDVQHELVEADEPVPEPDPGNTPVWQQVPKTEPQPVDRIPPTPPELEELTTPERESEETDRVEPELKDVAQVPDEPEARPEPIELADRGRRQRADIPFRVDDPTAEARQEVSVPTSRLKRTKGQAGLRENVTIDRAPTRGSVERPALDPSRLSRPMGLESPPIPSSGVTIKRATPGETIRRREGPVAGSADLDVAGADTAETTPGAAAGSPSSRRFTRIKRRRAGGRADGVPTRQAPGRIARTPMPRPGPTRSVRDGIASRLPVPGPRPNVSRPGLTTTPRRRELSLPATYRLRTLTQRRLAAQKFGGTDASERAVEASLVWLSRHQHRDGYWDSDGFAILCPGGQKCQDPGGRGLHGDPKRPEADRRAGLHADAGITALSLLAFLGAGYTHEEGPHAEQITRAIDWLIGQQRFDGFLGSRATRYAQNYCHAMATYALAEAYGMQSDKTQNARLKTAVLRAVAYIIAQQHPMTGGWRYVKGQEGDMSMFGWQLMALKSAEIAGLRVPERSKDLMFHFVNSRSRGQFKGLASYRPEDEVSPTMTAEALFSKQMLGIARDHPASTQAVKYLSGNKPKLSATNLYYWYYGTLAMYQYGGEPWQKWNGSLRNLLVATQRQDGHAKGSWDPRGPWGTYGGRIYATALSTLCLEVYYRFLPLYQLKERANAAEER